VFNGTRSSAGKQKTANLHQVAVNYSREDFSVYLYTRRDHILQNSRLKEAPQRLRRSVAVSGFPNSS
jgi:hypothetical protein